MASFPLAPVSSQRHPGMDFTYVLVTYDKEIGLKKKELEEESYFTKNSVKPFLLLTYIILQRLDLATLR